MAAGCERSVLLMFAALSLFCIFGVCAGQLSLVLTRREGPERNRITLTCFDGDFEVSNAVFYMRAPGAVTRVDENGSGLRDFGRDNNGAEIRFTITPETEGNFTCARTDGGIETSGLLVAAFRRSLQDNSNPSPPRTVFVFPRGIVQLQCDIQPGQARDLYSVQWLSNNQNLNDQTNFSLSVSVESMSENGTEYHCSVRIRSCFPGCTDAPVFDSPSIILIVGELISITQETENQEVFVGERANFTCSARGTDISIFWEIRGTEYRDCSTLGFCVTNMTEEGSAETISRFEIITGEDMIGQPIPVRCVVEQRFRDREGSQNSSTAQLTVISPTTSPTSTAPSPSPTSTLEITSTDSVIPTTQPAIPPAVLTIIYCVIGIFTLLVLVGLSFCTLICVLRICHNKGKIDVSENRHIPRSFRRMISGSGTYHPSHDYEDIEAQLTHRDGASKEIPPEYFEGVYSRQNGVPSDHSSGLYAELPFYSDDNMSEFFQEQIYNLSTKSEDTTSTYYPTYPNPFPHVTGSQQNLANSQMSLPLSGNEMYSRLYPPSTRQSRPRSISQSSDHSDHSQHSYRSQQSHRSNQSRHSTHSHHSNQSRHSAHSQHSNQSRHSNHSQHSNHSHHSNRSNHSTHSHHSNRSNVAEPQIPPFPMNPSGQPPLPSHPPLKQRTSIPDEILLTVVSCLMHRRNCQIPHCPCKSVQERYRELYRQNPSYHPHQHAAESCKKECGPNTDPGERKHQLHLTLSSQNLTNDTHPHYHLTTKSHIRRVMPKPPLVRQRSRSCDLTPNRDFTPEFPPVAPADAVAAPGDERSEVDGFYSDPTYEDYKPPFLREISISADNIPALCVNDCPLTPTPLREFRGLISSPMRSRSRRWSMPKKTLKTLEEKQSSTESSETNESNTSSRSGSHERLASVSDSERHSEQTGQKQTSSPIPPKSNGYRKVKLGESGYDSTIENTPPIPRLFNKVTSMGESGYDSNNYDTESESHSNPSSGKLPRKAQAMAHLQRQPNLVLSNSVEVTETLC